MAVAGQKQLMMDENLSWWAGRVRSAILTVDPTGLVAIGFLWPKTPNAARGGDSRVVRARPVIDSSSLDFFDIQLDPGVELTFPQYMENYELLTPAVKPVRTKVRVRNNAVAYLDEGETLFAKLDQLIEGFAR